MRFAIAFLAATMLLGAACPALAQQEMIYTASKLVSSLLPTVVNITSFVPQAGNEGKAGSEPTLMATQRRDLGSGFVIDRKGTIVTNFHVVEGASDIVITFSDGDQAHATLRAADRLADIAILDVRSAEKLTPVRWANDDDLHVGDPVIAIGNPLGVGMSVTSGIVSALNRNIMATPYDNYIQTDAPINHGNSGGPLFNLQGEVVGINTAIISPTTAFSGLGFAIPSRDARFVIGRLEKYGWIKPGYLGVKVQQITPELAEALGLRNTDGAIVAAVLAGGPAAEAGLQAGDIVTQYQGRTPTDERALLRMIAETPEGTHVSLRVLRRGKPMELTAIVGLFPRQRWEKVDQPVQIVEKELAVPADLGITVGPLLDADRVRLNIAPDTPGVLVTEVAPGTDAAWRGLSAGQAIERVDDQPVGSPDAYRAALAAARDSGRLFVAMLVASEKPVHPGPEWMALRLRP
ncbi:MAG TPA: trypsin-like peptidase domain-containing protein [Acetobacteraceae bacterium]|nr:trypsin-like peptidase domain-containing protein [Acetobacteraceae bacterium]